jgi:hypothetical protein
LKKITNLQLLFSDSETKDVYQDGVLSVKDRDRNEFVKNNSLFYTIKTYRKKSKLLNGELSGYLDGVGIQRMKVRLPKCDFAEITLSNYNDKSDAFSIINMFSNGEKITLDSEAEDPFINTDENAIQNTFDRLNLIGITFKVLLSEGVN